MNSTETGTELAGDNRSNVTLKPEDSINDSIKILRCYLLLLTTLLILTLNPFCLLVLRNVNSIQETSKVFLRSMSGGGGGGGTGTSQKS